MSSRFQKKGQKFEALQNLAAEQAREIHELQSKVFSFTRLRN